MTTMIPGTPELREAISELPPENIKTFGLLPPVAQALAAYILDSVDFIDNILENDNYNAVLAFLNYVEEWVYVRNATHKYWSNDVGFAALFNSRTYDYTTEINLYQYFVPMLNTFLEYTITGGNLQNMLLFEDFCRKVQENNRTQSTNEKVHH
jgi:hypothetical protein